jgi:hypothetical protein
MKQRPAMEKTDPELVFNAKPFPEVVENEFSALVA